MSLAVTQAGVILGNAAYMSLEQARGKGADRRADIWAFGVVLYEMLTGANLFAGDTITDTLASIVKEKPDLDRVRRTSLRLRVVGNFDFQVIQSDFGEFAIGSALFVQGRLQ
jgi:serine/threonine protein kinase